MTSVNFFDIIHNGIRTLFFSNHLGIDCRVAPVALSDSDNKRIRINKAAFAPGMDEKSFFVGLGFFQTVEPGGPLFPVAVFSGSVTGDFMLGGSTTGGNGGVVGGTVGRGIKDASGTESPGSFVSGLPLAIFQTGQCCRLESVKSVGTETVDHDNQSLFLQRLGTACEGTAANCCQKKSEFFEMGGIGSKNFIHFIFFACCPMT